MRSDTNGNIIKAPFLKFAAAILLTLSVSSCAGRAPNPVDVTQIGDENLSCDQIQAEIKSNNARISELAQERGAKVAQNIVAGVAGAIFILPLFLMDFQNAAGIEERALHGRNQYLGQIALRRCVN